MIGLTRFTSIKIGSFFLVLVFALGCQNNKLIQSTVIEIRHISCANNYSRLIDIKHFMKAKDTSIAIIENKKDIHSIQMLLNECPYLDTLSLPMLDCRVSISFLESNGVRRVFGISMNGYIYSSGHVQRMNQEMRNALKKMVPECDCF